MYITKKCHICDYITDTKRCPNCGAEKKNANK